MVSRLINPSISNSFFLFGARGTGKTSLLRERFTTESTLYLDLLKDSEFERLSTRPDDFLDQLKVLPSITRVIIDEVQKVPQLLDLVHLILEEERKHQFILTGSSSRKLKRGSANLLAGRAWVYHLFPLTSLELGESFRLDDALQWGTLPGLQRFISAEDKKEFLKAYTSTYLKEEILQEQLIRQLRPFQRFLPLAAQSSGTILNYSKIARDVGAAPPTVEAYFQILEDTMIGFRLPAFHKSLRKQERLSPKFYLFDTGITRALSRQLDVPVTPHTYAYGQLFEQFVLLEIIRLSSYQRRDDEFTYYTTHGGLEIDLVIDRASEPTVFIEIKSTTQVMDDHLDHLKSLRKEFPKASYFCFSLDPIPKMKDSIHCLPWQDGLKALGLK
jgi:uncharacterized protein